MNATSLTVTIDRHHAETALHYLAMAAPSVLQTDGLGVLRLPPCWERAVRHLAAALEMAVPHELAGRMRPAA